MSDINDLIARSSTIAYNSGYEAGSLAERKRIYALAKDAQCHIERDEVGDWVYIKDLIEYMEENND